MKVTHERDGAAVLRVRLVPDEHGEARIDPETTAGLRSALAAAEADVGCRVIVLEGTPGVFCLGLSFAAAAAEPATELRAFAGALSGLRETSRLVVSVVDGEAAGGGVALAAVADLALVTARSRFGLPEVALGILPALVLPVLLERMPPQRARLLALGGTIEAGRALALGLVDRVVEDGAALEAALRETLRHALRLHPGALGELKRLSTALSGLPFAGALQLGAEESARVLGDPVRGAALAAFEAGEPLPWFQRYTRKERA
jgi:enoyl-CoA hydratase/carnithine racemase